MPRRKREGRDVRPKFYVQASSEHWAFQGVSFARSGLLRGVTALSPALTVPVGFHLPVDTPFPQRETGTATAKPVVLQVSNADKFVAERRGPPLQEEIDCFPTGNGSIIAHRWDKMEILPPFEDRGSSYHFAILSRHQPAALKVAIHPEKVT